MKCWLFTILVSLNTIAVFAQPCISSYPYNEVFEANNGGWTPGGVSSDWTWGTPSKSVISGAGSGSRCWITGGLSNSTYNSNENSWLMSPCFNFTTITFPEINFKVFWDTERRFDGATFQYSTDGGINWTVLGYDNSNHCGVFNWYNASIISYLGNRSGWSGNTRSDAGSCLGGSGSGQWLTARHPLAFLAGETNVRFRFLFAAGSTCNSYDGFAVDDIEIKEAEIGYATINWTCQANNTILFSVPDSCVVDYYWNFGDPASGDNTSVDETPTHQYSGPGEYLVTLTTTFANGTFSTATKNLVILATSQSMTWPGACDNLADATLSVAASGSNTPYFYSWNTNPPQTTSSISNVGPGTYSVIVSSLNACSRTETFTLTSSSIIEINPVVRNSICGAGKGSVVTTASGGAAPLSYLWSNNATGTAINNLTAGTYSVVVTDAKGCTKTAGPFNIINEDRQLNISMGADMEICPGETISLSPGNYQSYLWQDGSTGSSFTTSSPGNYHVQVSDADGCIDRDTIRVMIADCRALFFPSAFTPNADGINDFFGPLGNTGLIRQFSLQVYNRFGQLIFSTYDHLQRWDGLYKGNPVQAGNYVWMCNYQLGNLMMKSKGSLLLIR